MDIVLIGSGNVATVLGRKSLAAGHRILQVYSNQEIHANRLSARLGVKSTTSVSGINRKADLMIVALRDAAIAPFMHALGYSDALVTHTAGALSISEVRNDGGSYGVLYPLQSLRKEIEVIPPLTMLVDGNKPETTDRLKQFAISIAETVIEANDETRLKYHLAGTIVNNFTNHLFAIAESFCKKENISFAVLQPLIEETAMRLRHISPGAAQTGPALRSDEITLQKHRNMLAAYPSTLRIYEMFTNEIQAFQAPKT